jgi:hypothetical protein
MKVIRFGHSLVQETADSIDEVTRSQAPNGLKQDFFFLIKKVQLDGITPFEILLRRSRKLIKKTVKHFK